LRPPPATFARSGEFNERIVSVLKRSFFFGASVFFGFIWFALRFVGAVLAPS
jgi:hypothetical protein